MLTNGKSAGFPAITLSNGLTVVNYSSPHPYKFETGEVLPACDEYLVKYHSLAENHMESPVKRGDVSWTDIKIVDTLTELQMESLRMLNADPDVDIVLVPLRVLKAIKKEYAVGTSNFKKSKFRVCRIEDRINKVLASDKFCR